MKRCQHPKILFVFLWFCLATAGPSTAFPVPDRASNPSAINTLRWSAPPIPHLRAPAPRHHHEFDPVFTTNYTKGRYQLPVYAKFNRPDPMRDWDWLRPHTLNLYEYCSNDPINGWDPDGFEWSVKVTKESGKPVFNLTFRGVLINESNRLMSAQETSAALGRIRAGVESSLNKNFKRFTSRVNFDVRPGSGADRDDSDHGIFIVERDDPRLGGSHGCVNQIGGMDIYIAADLVQGPGPGGDFVESGLSADGEPTLEQTGDHEVLHTAGMVHRDAADKDGNPLPHHVMTKSAFGKDAQGQPTGMVGFEVLQGQVVDIVERILRQDGVEINNPNRKTPEESKKRSDLG